MVVSDEGIVKLAREVHPLNADAPIDVTFDAPDTEINAVHPWNILGSRVMMADELIVTVAREVQPWNILAGRYVNDPVGTVTYWISVLLRKRLGEKEVTVIVSTVVGSVIELGNVPTVAYTFPDESIR